MAEFRWIDWNTEHTTIHGVSIEEAERVVRNAKSPEYLGNGKYRVYGRGNGQRMIHVIFIMDDDETIYIIHARPVTGAKKKRRMRRKEK